MSFLNYWRLAWLKFTRKERIVAVFFIAVFLFSFFWLVINFYYQYTEVVPRRGGVLRLGLIGQPKFINPLFIQANDCDRDLIELIYDGLFAINRDGQFEPELAEKFEISDNGRIYTLFLRDKVFWHDGIKFSADDVVFTIETIKNPLVKSPLRPYWQGIEVEKIGENVVRFRLKESYEPFLQSLTLKIIPRHLWLEIEPAVFNLAEYNLKPIGTGPFRFQELKKSKTGRIINYLLTANNHYFKNDHFFKSRPFLRKIIVNFYADYEESKRALLRREVDSLMRILPADSDYLAKKRYFNPQALFLPRYYAIFFNLPRAKLFTQELREALSLAIDYQEIITKVFYNQALPFNNSSDAGRAKEILLKEKWQDVDGDGFLEKTFPKEKKPTPLTLSLALPEEETLIKVGELLKGYWQEIGVKVTLNVLPVNILEKEIIQTRDFEALLFGSLVGLNPDFYPFWHSSQINSPGLNLSGYKNKKLDALLEKRKHLFNSEEKESNLAQIKEILNEDKPAIFLYNPFYLYTLPLKIKGNQISKANFPAERLADIENWYLYTRRQLKKSQ